MTRGMICAAICALVAVACGRTEDVPQPIVQTGCLTGAEGKFVLTDLESGNTEAQPRATTETFQLVGNEDQLRPHVGRQVRVTGEAEAPAVIEARESTPPEPTATTGSGEPEPQVSTQESTRLEVSRLRVASVTPTGEECSEQTP